MRPQIQSISPCEDWYYVHKDADGKSIIHRLAVWGIRDNGEVIGLISALGANTEDNIARLVPPPGLGGKYLHRDSLSGEEIKMAGARARPPNL